MLTDNELNKAMDEAVSKAYRSLARYKFIMFGYWAAVWVHLNKLSGKNYPNPFLPVVSQAKHCSREWDAHMD